MTAAVESASRILVVDDNEANRDLLSRRLQRQGHRVEMAVHGREATRMLEASAFDLVLLDIMMPEMDGYQVLAWLRSHGELSELPVIMISAVNDADAVIRCIEMGADDHLPKPFDPHILRARVEAVLSKKKLRDRERQYAESLARELEIGRRIQQGFLPEDVAQPPGWEIAARFQPARQVAGDFYDVFPLGDGRVGLVVADVCDKGVGAALFMALFRTLVRAMSQESAGTPSPDLLRRTVRFVNDYIAKTHGKANMFATLVFAVLDHATGTLDYVNGGHEAPAVIAGGRIRSRLVPTGPALGLMPDMEFSVASEKLDPGTLLVMFTDGATDARDAAGATLGEDAVLAAAATATAASAALDAVTAAIAAHSAGGDPFDDVTLLALRRA